MTTPKLVSRSEEIVTHTLGHILSSSEVSRQALRDFLLTRDVDIGEIKRVDTQNQGKQGGGIPDLVTYDESGAERLLLEAKFWAGLTSNQPVTYLQRLPKDKPSVLLLVAPPVRLEELWQELRGRVSAEDCFDPINVNVEPEIRWCNVDEHRKLILTSWRFLLDSIAAQASSAVARTVNDIHQLQDMAELRGFDPPQRGPLTPEFPRALPLLYGLIDDTVERLIERSRAEIPGGAYRPDGASCLQRSIHDILRSEKRLIRHLFSRLEHLPSQPPLVYSARLWLEPRSRRRTVQGTIPRAPKRNPHLYPGPSAWRPIRGCSRVDSGADRTDRNANRIRPTLT